MSHPKGISPGRLLVDRLVHTPAENLPYIVPALLDLLVAATDELGQHAPSSSRKGGVRSDHGLLQHRLKIQLTTLLQARKHQARWTAVVLIKTFAQIAGADFLKSCVPWVKAMVSLLGHKTEHWVVKKASVTTLTKIFFLSYGVPTLVRELTTPALQTFLVHCLGSVGAGEGHQYRIHAPSQLLKCILQSFVLLLPRHPASFRPRLPDLRKILSRLIARTPSHAEDGDRHYSADVYHLARRVLAILPYAAPKNGASEEWSQNVDQVLQHIMRTSDRVFRALREDVLPSRIQRRWDDATPGHADPLKDDYQDFLGLRGWHGINAGCERLLGCLEILGAFLATTSDVSLVLPVDSVWESIDRIFALHGPYIAMSGDRIQPHYHPEADRDERESLCAHISLLHESSLRVLSILLQRLGRLDVNLSQLCMNRLIDVFERDRGQEKMRSQIYKVATNILEISGAHLTKFEVTALQPLLQAACNDTETQRKVNGEDFDQAASQQRQNASLLGQAKSEDAFATNVMEESLLRSLQCSALSLLGQARTYIASDKMAPALIATIDRALILTQDEGAMMATVLNPSRRIINGGNTSSNLPFLARAHPAANAVEAMLRPRLPVILIKREAKREEGTVAESSSHSFLQENNVQSSLSNDPGIGEINIESENELDVEEPMVANEISIMSPKRRRDSSPEPEGVIYLAEDAAEDAPPSPKRAREGSPPEAMIDIPSGSQQPILSAPAHVEDVPRASEPLEDPLAVDSDEIPSIDLPSELEDTESESENDEVPS